MMGVALATLIGFMSGEKAAGTKQELADEKQKVKELETDGQNKKAVADLSDDELDAELRDGPRW